MPPEYELRLRFTAADDHQAIRLGFAWADTCAAEYGTHHPSMHGTAGVRLVRTLADLYIEIEDEKGD